MTTLTNLRDLALYLGVPPCFEGDFALAIQRCVYKYTDCGCVFTGDDESVTVAGYAEGSDVELPIHELRFPFDARTFDLTLDIADEEGSQEWYRANIDPMECPRCGEIELYCIGTGDGLVEYECENCHHYETGSVV